MIDSFSIRKIHKEDAILLLEKYHYLGRKDFRKSTIYGLWKDRELLGACVFHGVSAPETCVGAFGLKRDQQEGIYELGRLVMHPGFNGGNYTSWFVSRCIKQLCKSTNVRAIISYADSSAGHTGAIYKACNALYCGLTEPKNDYWVDGKIQERGKCIGGEWKPRSQKHRYVWLFDETLNLNWKIVSCNVDGLPKWLKRSMHESIS